MKEITLEELRNTSYTLDVVEDMIEEDPNVKIALDLSGVDGVEAYVFGVVSDTLTHDKVNEILDRHVPYELLHSDYCPMPCVFDTIAEVENDTDYCILVR